MLKGHTKGEKGFTLAELLIVVAIIGVLVAVSIPIFVNQLEKSREATDVGNYRAAKAALIAAYITNDYAGKDGTENGLPVLYYDAQSGLVTKYLDEVHPYGQGTPNEAGYEDEWYEANNYVGDTNYRGAYIYAIFRDNSEGSHLYMRWKNSLDSSQVYQWDVFDLSGYEPEYEGEYPTEIEATNDGP